MPGEGVACRRGKIGASGCGWPQHATQRGNRRMLTFSGDDEYRVCLSLLAGTGGHSGILLGGYCLMPDQPATPGMRMLDRRTMHASAALAPHLPTAPAAHAARHVPPAAGRECRPAGGRPAVPRTFGEQLGRAPPSDRGDRPKRTTEQSGVPRSAHRVSVSPDFAGLRYQGS